MDWARKKVDRIDLSETNDFFIALKQEPAWRERLVAELRFGLRNHIRSINSYQVNFPPELLEKFKTGDARTANVLLPLTTREKRPLLNLGVMGPSGAPATVLARRSIAALQTQYLVALAEESPARHVLLPSVDDRLLEAICGFSPSFFERMFFNRSGERFLPAITSYLNSGLRFNVTEDDVRRWPEATAEAGRALAEHLPALPKPHDSSEKVFSSSEEALLAIPDLSPPAASISEVDEVVARFASAVKIAKSTREHDWLAVLAEYGCRYELIVEVELPLREASRVRIEEDLPLDLKRCRTQYWVRQAFALGEAGSAHLEARLDDPNVEIPERRRGQIPEQGIRVHEAKGGDAGGWLEAVRVTREALAIYGSDPERPNSVLIEFRLRMARQVMATTVLLAVLNVLAIAFSLLLGSPDELASRLAVITVPTTVAAAFVLGREQTALAARLQTIPRLALAMSAVALWVAVGVQLLTSDGGADSGQKVRPSNSPQLVAPLKSGTIINSNGGSHGEEWRKREGSGRRG
jgi:hypothetical protein